MNAGERDFRVFQSAPTTPPQHSDCVISLHPIPRVRRARTSGRGHTAACISARAAWRCAPCCRGTRAGDRPNDWATSSRVLVRCGAKRGDGKCVRFRTDGAGCRRARIRRPLASRRTNNPHELAGISRPFGLCGHSLSRRKTLQQARVSPWRAAPGKSSCRRDHPSPRRTRKHRRGRPSSRSPIAGARHLAVSAEFIPHRRQHPVRKLRLPP